MLFDFCRKKCVDKTPPSDMKDPFQKFDDPLSDMKDPPFGNLIDNNTVSNNTFNNIYSDTSCQGSP